jgi:uncharacterized protein YigA (DUF484 family)
MAFPEEQPANFLKRVKNFIYGSSEIVHPLNFTDAQTQSLSIFLEDQYKLLRSLDSPSSKKMTNLERFVGIIFKIYEQLRRRQTCIDSMHNQDDMVASGIAQVSLEGIWQ